MRAFNVGWGTQNSSDYKKLRGWNGREKVLQGGQRDGGGRGLTTVISMDSKTEGTKRKKEKQK